MKLLIRGNGLSLIPWLWLLLAIINCLTQTAMSVSPNNYTVGTLLPSSLSANHIVMESGYFQVDVRSWNSKTSPGYLCMAGIKHTKINPGSTLWAAHGAQPVAHRCQLRLSPTGLALIDMDDNAAAADWSTPTFKNVANITLLDSGNLILQDTAGEILWQSFHQTTVFGILPGMNFTTNFTLYSTDVSPDSTGVDDWSVAPGSYALRLHEDGVVYLYLSRGAARADNSAGGDGGFVYWVYNIYSNKSASNPKVAYMALDPNTSVFHFYDAQSQLISAAATLPATPPTPPDELNTSIAIIEHSGGYFSIFDYIALNESNKFWTTAYNANDVASPAALCQIFTSGSCGSFSLCRLSDGNCYCPDGFSLQSDRNCAPANAIEPNCSISSDYSFKILRVPNVAFPPQLPPLPSAASETQCGDRCRQNCNCTAALYDPSSSTCTQFTSVRAVPTYDTKSGSSSSSDQVLLLKIAVQKSNRRRNIIILAALLCAAAVLALCCCCVILWIVLRRRRKRKPNDDWEKEFLEVMPRLPPRFSYKEMEAATKGFSVKLGSGGFGCVYEGDLPSGQKVAVKKLEFVGEGNEVNRRRYIQTFRAELLSIGAASHVNLVTLKGFCIDEDAKLLVYEFMPNGSLDRWLFCKDNAELDWRRRFAIALDTAKGLAYLHHECAERIVHCDIKPENILLDEKFRAKVADFGLAKLMENEKQGFTMTTVKGTRGYLAPEWLQESTITTKSDVYSYGVVLLELISGRRCLEAGGYLPVMAMQALGNSIRSLTSASSSDGKQSRSTLSSNDEKIYRSGVVSVVQSLLDERLSNVGGKQSSSEELSVMKGKQESAEMDDNVDEDGSRAAMERMVVVALWCVQRDPALRPTMASVVQMLEGKEEVPPAVLRSATGEAMIYLGDIIYDDRVLFSGQSSAAATLDSEWSIPHPR